MGEGYGSIHTVDYVLDLNNPEVEKKKPIMVLCRLSSFYKILHKFEESGSEDPRNVARDFDKLKVISIG